MDILWGRRRRDAVEKRRKSGCPVESAITAQGITTQRFRIMKKGGCCFFDQRIKLSVHIQRLFKEGYRRWLWAKGSVLRAAWSVGLKRVGGNKGHPQTIGGLGVAKIWTNPDEVKGLGPRQCNCGDVMKKKGEKKDRNCTLLSMHNLSIHYSERAGINPPRTHTLVDENR